MSSSLTSTTSTHTIVLKPGETFVLPKNGSLVFVSDPSGVESDCVAIPDATYRCGYFYLVLDQDSNTGHAMDETHTNLKTLKVGSTTYDMADTRVIIFGDNPGLLVQPSTLNNLIPDQAIFTFTSTWNDVGPDKRQYVKLYFKVLDSLYDTLDLVVGNWESISHYKSFEEVDCA